MGTGKIMLGAKPCDGLPSHPGGSRNVLSHSMLGNRDKLWQCGSLGSTQTLLALPLQARHPAKMNGVENRNCAHGQLLMVILFSISRSLEPSNHSSPVSRREPDLLSSDNPDCSSNMQGVWCEIQLQGYILAGAWFSYWASQETGAAKRRTQIY